jgi:DNA-binding NtrC family response regulator
LRERTEDLPALVAHFVDTFNRRLGKQIETIPQRTLDALTEYGWPGNVRELENRVHRAVIISEGKELLLDAPEIGGGPRPETTALADVERRHIRHMLTSCHWKIEGKGGAAERLGIHPSTLRSRMKRLGIHKPEQPPRDVLRPTE